jgi:hypothetical protein
MLQKECKKEPQCIKRNYLTNNSRRGRDVGRGTQALIPTSFMEILWLWNKIGKSRNRCRSILFKVVRANNSDRL